MNNVSTNNKNNQDIQNNIQAKIKFRKDMQTLRMNLPGIDKSLINKGYGYKYQNFNDIVEEIYNVIKKHNLELDFEQNPISKEGQYGIFDYIRTTFYSTSAEYEESFDTRIHIDGSKNNSIPQQVGSAITYFKRYALVGHLNIKSEVDTDAAPNYDNSYENENSTPNRQVSVNRKQEQKKDRLYYYNIFKEALSNIKNWVNSSTTKDNINSIIQKISFIQNIDPNNVDDIKKIEADLISYFEKNSDFKSINYWAEIIKDYFKKNNRLKDLQDFEKFMSFKRTTYGPSPLLFFCTLKEEKQFDYIFAA
ncbi:MULTISPECIES: ERF family protein [Borreliella]|uniref:Single-stranded DNA-binding protein n=3 Tax=Borreliella TaxID=64895 RepID=A0ABM7AR63_BORGP|nr:MULTISPECIES: ERF family protein [Borreliella]AZA27209.1 single-stranded DNA-binding protein [Borreliella bavariensis PBi]